MLIEKLSSREKILFFGTSSIIAIAVFYGLILEPISKNWKRLSAQILTDTTKLNKNLQIISAEAAIRKEYNKYSKYTQALGSDEEVIAYLLQIIEQKASATSAHITNIKPRSPKAEDQYKLFKFEVISESSLNQLLKFIYDLQNSSELLRVTRLTISLKSGAGQTLRGVMEIEKVSQEPAK